MSKEKLFDRPDMHEGRRNVFDKWKLYDIMINIDKLHSDVFSSKTLGRMCDMSGRSLVYYLSHLLDAGAIEVHRRILFPQTGKTRKIIYKRNFGLRDIGGYISRMRFNDVERRKIILRTKNEYKRGKEKYIQYQRDYREKYKDRFVEYGKRYYQKHKEELSEKRRLRRIKNAL